MDKEKVLEKIKKCLALSKSANEHEAALALKQAQAMMREYGIHEQDVALADVLESNGVKSEQSLVSWKAVLINTIAEAFGVRAYITNKYGRTLLKFYGIDGKPEVAEYAYSVLLRQLRNHRREYLNTVLKRVRLVKNKTARADAFCLGWVCGVREKVQKFALNQKEIDLLEAFEQNKAFTESKVRETKGSKHAQRQAKIDRVLGKILGGQAELNHAVSQEKQAMIGEG